MESIYNFLNIQDRSKIISCLVIYSNQNASTELSKLKLTSIKEPNYVDFYKIGIQLPQIN
jgi:hypothetical protein